MGKTGVRPHCMSRSADGAEGDGREIMSPARAGCWAEMERYGARATGAVYVCSMLWSVYAGCEAQSSPFGAWRDGSGRLEHFASPTRSGLV